jgi:agmatine/peptidylarginine deiminase
MTTRELTLLEQAVLVIEWGTWLESATKELCRVKANLVEHLSEEEEKGEKWDTCVDLLEELEELKTVRNWDLSIHSCAAPMKKKIVKDLERLDDVDNLVISNLQAFLAASIGWMPPGFQ